MGGSPKGAQVTCLTPETPKDEGGASGATGDTSGTSGTTSIRKATVTVASKTYTGKAQKPAVKVTYAGKALVLNTDYTVKYSNNMKVGTAKVTITGKGKYSGKVTKTFSILPKNTGVKKAAGGKRSITVRWSPLKTKMSKSRITGYQVRYSLKSNMASSKTVTAKGYTKAGVTIGKLKASKKYYVQVRTYMKVGTKNYYSSWSSKKAVRTS